MLASGQLLATDLAWFSGAAEWKPLGEVLGGAPAPAPPPPPPKPSSGTMPKRQVAGGKPEEKKEGESSEDGEGDDPDKIHVTRKGEAIGPYSREKAREYFAAGTLLPTDWAWHDGMGEDWKPINEVLGLPVPGGAGGGAASDGPWTIGGCLREGNQSFKQNTSGAVGITFLFFILMVITGSLPLINLFLQGPIVAGMLYYFIKLNRQEPASVGDLFSGFKRGYGQLLLLSILGSLIWLVATLPGISVLIFMTAEKIGELAPELAAASAGSDPVEMGKAKLKIIGAILSGSHIALPVMILVPAIALSFTIFSTPLVIDRQMKAMDALKASARLMKGQWFKVVFFTCLMGLISQLGIIVLLVGILTTFPIAMSAMASCYLKNAATISAEHTAPISKGMKIGLVFMCILPIGAAVGSTMMNLAALGRAAGDANGTDANGTGAGDIKTEVLGIYMVGDTGKGSRNGRPDIQIMEFKEGGFGNLTEPFKPNKRDGFKWSIDPDNKGQIVVEPDSAPPAAPAPPTGGQPAPPVPPAGNPPPPPKKIIIEYIPGVGMKSIEADGQAAPKTLMLRVDKIVGQYVAKTSRLVFNADYSAELWVNGNKALTGKWYVSGGAKGTPSEIWVMGQQQYHLILSVDTTQQPFSLKSVANLMYNEATKKINRFPSPPQGQLTYTRSKGGEGGSGTGQEPGMEPGSGLDGQ